MKYCRYCSYCILGDSYYCTCHDKVLKRVDKPTSCTDYVESELGDVETGKKYSPRAKDDLNQISLQLEKGADNDRREAD
jgi:hypothetical protein